MCCGEDENDGSCVHLPLGDVLEYALAHSDDDPLYIFDSHYAETCPWILQGYRPSCFSPSSSSSSSRSSFSSSEGRGGQEGKGGKGQEGKGEGRLCASLGRYYPYKDDLMALIRDTHSTHSTHRPAHRTHQAYARDAGGGENGGLGEEGEDGEEDDNEEDEEEMGYHGRSNSRSPKWRWWLFGPRGSGTPVSVFDY